MTPPPEQLVSAVAWWAGWLESSCVPPAKPYALGFAGVKICFCLLFSPACLPPLRGSVTFIPGQSHGVGKQLPPPHPAERGSEEVAEKWGKSWRGERTQSQLAPVSAEPSSTASSYGWAAKHREALNDYTHGEKGKKTGVWSEINQDARGRDLLSFLLLYQRPERESQPDNERERFPLRPDLLRTWVDLALPICSFQERTCPVFSFLSLVCRLFFIRFLKHPVPFPLGCLSPEALPVFWLHGFMHQLLFCGDPTFTGSQNNKLGSGYS